MDFMKKKTNFMDKKPSSECICNDYHKHRKLYGV